MASIENSIRFTIGLSMKADDATHMVTNTERQHSTRTMGVRYIRAHYFTALDQHGILYEYWITEVIQPVNSELTGILLAPDQAHIMDLETTKHFSNGDMMYILCIDSNSENHWLNDFYARADAIAEARREEALRAEVVLQAEQLLRSKTCKG